MAINSLLATASAAAAVGPVGGLEDLDIRLTIIGHRFGRQSSLYTRSRRIAVAICCSVSLRVYSVFSIIRKTQNDATN